LGARGILLLQSYGQDEPVFDNNAYTITSTYHDGTLKIYNVYPSRPASPGGRPQFYIHQVNTWGMTGNTDRQGAAAYRERAWAKEQRDRAITQANERVGDSQATALTPDASFGQVYSFTSEPTMDDTYTTTTEVLSQESRTLPTDDSNSTSHLQESETSSIELSLDDGLPAKRSGKHSKQSFQNQRKRHNAGESNDDSE
jgi:hypothetical protein